MTTQVNSHRGLGSETWKTTLWSKEKGMQLFRLMNTIVPGVTFREVDTSGLHLKERQLAVAIDQMEGWRRNGGMGSARFKIVQTNLANRTAAPETHMYGPGSS